MTTPPMPAYAPYTPPTPPPSRNGGGPPPSSRPRPGSVPDSKMPGGGRRNVNKTKNGGGFNPSLNGALNITLTVPGGGNAAGGGAGAAAGSAAGRAGGTASVPGADFNGPDDIYAYAEFRRKAFAKLAIELSMDAEALQAVLGAIPNMDGTRSTGMGGNRAKARRVARHAKRLAAAQKTSAREAKKLWAAYTREYQVDIKWPPGRPRPRRMHLPRL